MKRLYLSFLILALLFHAFRCFKATANLANLKLDFSQNNQTYNWNNRMEYLYNKDPKLSWELIFSLNSLLIKEAIQDRWQEGGNLKLKFDYLVKKDFKTGVLINHKLSSLGDRKITSQDYLVTSELNFWQRFKLSQNLGISSLSRKSDKEKEEESGLNYSLNLGFGPVIWKKAELTLDLGQDVIDLEKIPTQDRNLRFNLQRNLSEKNSLNLEYEEGWSKKSFFSGEGSRTYTQRRKERILRLDTFRKIILNLLLKFEYNFLRNNYRYQTEEDTLADPLSLRDNSLSSQDYTVSLSKTFFNWANLEGFYKYLSGEEDYGLKERNQDMKSGELGGRLSTKFSSSDSVFVTASMGVTSFYTSPGSFFNDRDILTKILHLEYLHIFSRSFNLKIKTGFKNFHQVYVSSQKSANNNYNETYILSPALSWKITPKLGLFQEYQIQANYISYDFQKETESNQNKIFRRASTFTRLSYIPYRRLEGEFSYLYKYEDFGQLLWKDEWVRRPGWERKTQGFGMALRYKPAKSLVFSSEYNYEKRKEWKIYLDLPTGKEKKVYSYKFYRNLLTFSLDYMTDDRNYLKLLWTIRAQREMEQKEELSNFITISLGRNW